MVLLAVGTLLAPTAVLAQRKLPENQPQPPQQRYNPDQEACKSERLIESHKRRLAPYSDFPPAVLEKLRQLQNEMLQNSLRDCLQQGLLSAQQVTAIERELGLTASPPAQPSGQRP